MADNTNATAQIGDDAKMRATRPRGAAPTAFLVLGAGIGVPAPLERVGELVRRRDVAVVLEIAGEEDGGHPPAPISRSMA